MGTTRAARGRAGPGAGAAAVCWRATATAISTPDTTPASTNQDRSARGSTARYSTAASVATAPSPVTPRSATCNLRAGGAGTHLHPVLSYMESPYRDRAWQCEMAARPPSQCNTRV